MARRLEGVVYEPYEEGVETDGRAIRSVVEGVASVSAVFEDRALSVLENNGISDPQPGEWYPMEDYLGALAELQDSIGPNTVQQVGKKIPEVVEWPAEIDTVPEALAQLDDIYRMNHRGGEIGFYEFESTGDREGEMTCQNPYPCSLDQGLVTGTVRKFSPEGSFTRVEEPGPCRMDGADACVYSVSW